MATNLSPLTVVGVNNGSVTTQAGGTGIRRVLITPLGQPGRKSVPPVIVKVFLKAVAKTGKKKDKIEEIFTLHRINTDKVCTCDGAKEADQEAAV